MKVVVCIKQVPDTAEVRLDPETNTLIREGVPSILNPLDTFAIEAAVAIAEKQGGEAVALSMGPPQAEAAVREAIALGCERGILLTDKAFAGSDTWVTSLVLAAAIRRLADVRLVLCGKQAIDGDTAQVGPGIAAHLGWPQATYVRRILELNDESSLVERLTDVGGETVKVRLPAVFTVLKDLNVPRLPTLTSQMRARRRVIETRGREDLKLHPALVGLEGSPTRVKQVFAPPSRGGGQVWTGSPKESAGKLLDALRKSNVLSWD